MNPYIIPFNFVDKQSKLVYQFRTISQQIFPNAPRVGDKVVTFDFYNDTKHVGTVDTVVWEITDDSTSPVRCVIVLDPIVKEEKV